MKNEEHCLIPYRDENVKSDETRRGKRVQSNASFCLQSSQAFLSVILGDTSAIPAERSTLGRHR